MKTHTLSTDKLKIGDTTVTVRNRKIAVTLPRSEWDRRVERSTPVDTRAHILTLAMLHLDDERRLQDQPEDDGWYRVLRTALTKDYLARHYPEELKENRESGPYPDPAEGLWGRIGKGHSLSERQEAIFSEARQWAQEQVDLQRSLRKEHLQHPTGAESWDIDIII